MPMPAGHMSKEAPFFTSRRFFPIFAAQFLGALEDNLFRNSVIILVTFRLAAEQGYNAGLVISLGTGLFILPFFLFSATAGTLADRVEKTGLVRWLMFSDLALMLMAGFMLVISQIPLLLLMMFVLGFQSALFGPVKYSILPQLVREDELVKANAYIQAGTFMAILTGTIIGGAVVILPYGTVAIACLMILSAATGWTLSFLMPRTDKPETEGREPALRWTSMIPLMHEVRQNPVLWGAIIGISWFWFTGTLFLSLLPNYVKDVLAGTPELVTYLLALFVVGVALGSGAANKLLKGSVDTRFVPFGIVVMGLSVLLLAAISGSVSFNSAEVTLGSFVTSSNGIVLSLLFLLAAASGGFYTVPLHAALQSRSDPDRRARVIAAENIISSLFMVMASAFSFVLFNVGAGVTAIFGAAGALSLLAAFLATEYLPYKLYAAVLRLKFSLFYGARVRGLHHTVSLGYRGTVYIVNHTSLLDGLLLAAFLPGCPLIAAYPALARSFWMSFYHIVAGHPPLDPSNPSAVKYLVNALKNGRSVVLFPEGRMTQTGLVMKVHETPGVIARMAKAPIVPVRIDGAQYTPFSLLRGKVRLRLFPRLTITVLPPVTLKGDPEAPSRVRRLSFGEQLYDIMADVLFASCNLEQTLYEAFLDAGRVHGQGTKIVEDLDRSPKSYRQLNVMSRVLGRAFASMTAPGENVGVMLPNGAGVVGVFLGLLAFGRVPALMNFAGGLVNLESACRTAGIKTILTSRRFIGLLELESAVEALGQQVRIVYLEDVKKSLGRAQALRGVWESFFAVWFYRKLKVRPDDPAVVLFTSGSESAPKGVVLSHKNILANRYQAAARIDLNAHDLLFNALPVFHSFGLSVGLFLPLLTGVKVFLYPSPLHYRVIPELVYDTNATILISTDTFLSGYARMAHAFDFYSLRYVVAGGERLKDETRRLWFDKFGIRILEGYGVTETSPVLAINTSMHHKTGTVGRLVPGIEHRLRNIEGIGAGGSLEVRGPNVMLGYLKEDKPGVLQPPKDGWHDTGDVVEIDEEGFVKIIGRAKRFAKIGGEMISLAAVESLAQDAFPEHLAAAVVAPDVRKGEQIILFTNSPSLTRELLVEAVHKRHMPEIMIPRHVIRLDEMPLLGTGKIDYVSLGRLMAERKDLDGL